MSKESAPTALRANQPDVFVKKFGGHDGARRVLSDEKFSAFESTNSWRVEGDIIYFSVTSDGTTGDGWIARLENKGFRVDDYAKEVLRSPDFQSTSGVTTEVAVLRGMLFEDKERLTTNIRAEAEKRRLSKPSAELACLIREKLADEEIERMGLWYIVAMHEPIKDSSGVPSLLCASRNDGGHRLRVRRGRSDRGWVRGFGFAFAVS